MKIRADFVTNSSSSSFILAFSDEESIKRELVEGFNDDEIADFPKVYLDVMEAERLGRGDVEKQVFGETAWPAISKEYSRRREELPEFAELNPKLSEWSKTDEARAVAWRAADHVVRKAGEKLDKEVLVQVEYSDHPYEDLENPDALDRHPCTAFVFKQSITHHLTPNGV